ncbi:MAG: ROK family protein [Austwickia sp.]|nr:ROK family protein [Austwickia sp.]
MEPTATTSTSWSPGNRDDPRRRHRGDQDRRRADHRRRRPRRCGADHADARGPGTPGHPGRAGRAAGAARRDGCDRGGVSTAGVVDTTTGTITTATTSLRGWSGTPVAAVVSERIGLPVHVLNDGLAFGVGESVYGLGSRLRGTGGRVPSMLLVVVGTGIGGAIVVGDDPWLGARGVAGHVGHVPVPEADGLPCPCGRTGHVEAVGGGAGLLAAYHRGGGDRSVGSAREVLAAAQTLARTSRWR